MRFTVAFGILGIFLAGLAIRLGEEAHGAWWIIVGLEAYASICLLALAVIYGLRNRRLGIERLLIRPVWSPVFHVILLPYLVLGATSLYVHRWFNREGLLNRVAPGLFIGRLPFPFERGALQEAGIEAVLNLCWEFPRIGGADSDPAFDTALVPILDGVPPSDEQFQESSRHVLRWHDQRRCVLIHCAQGHGRSATITAAALIDLGLAPDALTALKTIRAVRHLAKPSREQQLALVRYASKRDSSRE
jgi:hypothetical protein